MKHYYTTTNRLPYKKRIRNRCLAIAGLVLIGFGIGALIFGNDPASEPNDEPTTAAEEAALEETEEYGEYSQDKQEYSKKLAAFEAEEAAAENKRKEDNLQNTRSTLVAEMAPGNAPEVEVIDSVHIKKQKNVFLAEKIDQMLRRYRPDYGVILVVDAKSNEIIAWGERRDNKVQNQPDYFVKNSFPAASLAKTVTIAAAMESNRYSLDTEIPMRGASHTLYKSQLKVSDDYTGPTIPLEDAYAKSSNAPLAIIGMNVGANKLRKAAKNLGYNINFPGGIPARANYAPPDTGYGLAETSCGFTESTTLPPLLAAAQVRAILMKQPLEIPWAANLAPYAPTSRKALDGVTKFSENTYYGLREAMIRTVTNGTARKHMSRKNMARKNYDALVMGGKTGSLDGKDPAGRYEWYMGFAQSKSDANKAIVVVVMQVHKEIRSQPATQVAAVIINHWAHQNLNLGK